MGRQPLILFACGVALLLAGCADGRGESATATVTVTSTPDDAASASGPTDDDIPASSTNPDAFGSDESFAITDPQFIAKAREEVGEGPTDAQLRELGKSICKDLDGGTRVKQEILTVSEGQQGFTQEQVAYLVGISVRAYCPEYEGEVRALATDNSGE